MKIIYSGPIATEGKPSAGGYEAANRKNIDMLRRRGTDVTEMPYPRVNRRLGKLGKLVYARLWLDPLRLLRYCGRKDVILHSTPPRSPLHKPAIFIHRIARRMGIRILLDVRGGSLMTYYNAHGGKNRREIRKLLGSADIITVEGSEYIRNIREDIGIDRPVFYFPNTTICDSTQFIPRDTGRINLFYFGRITGNKGIGIMLDVIRRLDDRFRLYLAGPLAPDVTEAELKQEKVTYLGLLKPQELKERMTRMHVFMFPTSHSGEGQSNSLIEAMGMGLIPVTSSQGFCREVTAGCGICLPAGAGPDDYLDAVLRIAGSDINAMGKKCHEHIVSHHNTATEIDRLIGIYESMIRG